MNSLEQSCYDILYKNMNYTNEKVFLLYDTESPLAKLVSDAYKKILPETATQKEFIVPPQPLYRGGMINPDNPHIKEQNRIVTTHNISENEKIGLDHHKNIEVKTTQ